MIVLHIFQADRISIAHFHLADTDLETRHTWGMSSISWVVCLLFSTVIYIDFAMNLHESFNENDSFLIYLYLQEKRL